VSVCARAIAFRVQNRGTAAGGCLQDAGQRRRQEPGWEGNAARQAELSWQAEGVGKGVVPPVELFADHEPLPLLGETVLENPPDPVRLVTFLNRTLKSAGLVFGLKQLPDGRFRLAVYQTEARSGG